MERISSTSPTRKGLRATWYDQLLVSRCKLDKQLESGYLSSGAREVDFMKNLNDVANCEMDIAQTEGKANLLKLIQESR